MKQDYGTLCCSHVLHSCLADVLLADIDLNVWYLTRNLFATSTSFLARALKILFIHCQHHLPLAWPLAPHLYFSSWTLP